MMMIWRAKVAQLRGRDFGFTDCRSEKFMSAPNNNFGAQKSRSCREAILVHGF
jgi:hypothetical protein